MKGLAYIPPSHRGSELNVPTIIVRILLLKTIDNIVLYKPQNRLPWDFAFQTILLEQYEKKDVVILQILYCFSKTCVVK